MKTARIGGATLAIALFLIAAGCGDNGSSTATTSTQATISKQEYVSRVTDLCGQYTKDRHAAEKPLASLSQKNPADLTSADAKSAAPALAAIDEIDAQLLAYFRALPDPEQGADLVHHHYDLVEAGFAASERGTAAAKRGDVDAMVAAFKVVQSKLEKRGDRSADYGFGACG